MKKERYFPCPYCKGQGGWCDDTDDYGNCIIPIDCSYCETEGMIEIGGEIQKRNKALKVGLEHLVEDKEYTELEIINIGMKFL